MSGSTVLPAQGRAQAPAPSVRPPLEQAQDWANVFRNTHTTEERWSLLRGRYLVCTSCDQPPRDYRDGRPATCDVGFLARLLAEVPRERYLPSRVDRPVTPRLPQQWMRP